MSRQFDVVVERDAKGFYVASVPALQGCHTQAKSLDDLMLRVREAIELCLEVPEGGAGIEALRRHPADVVVTDLFISGMEGIETIAELRQHYPDARIIAIFGGSRLRGAGADHLAVAREIGADRVLRKPFDPAKLVAAVEQVLG